MFFVVIQIICITLPKVIFSSKTRAQKWPSERFRGINIPTFKPIFKTAFLAKNKKFKKGLLKAFRGINTRQKNKKKQKNNHKKKTKEQSYRHSKKKFHKKANHSGELNYKCFYPIFSIKLSFYLFYCILYISKIIHTPPFYKSIVAKDILCDTPQNPPNLF